VERYIAVDDVCAWPNLTAMPDGAIIATIFNQPTHGGWEGDVDCWVSEDDGRTWTFRSRPAGHEPGTNRMNVAAGLARDGALVVLASGWDKREPARRHTTLPGSQILPAWVCRSSDGGHTWERTSIAPRPPDADSEFVPFGDTVQLPDGGLGVSFYGRVRLGHPAWFYRSDDDGRTWTPAAPIRTENATETTLLVLPGGPILAAMRTEGDQHLDLLASEDGGHTWAERGPLTLGRQHPGHLLRLADGRLLLTFGIRNKGLHGVGARISPDCGGTWGPPHVLVHLNGAGDCGYPSSVQVADGTVVTAYYCNGIPSHQRYHMGVLRWKPEE